MLMNDGCRKTANMNRRTLPFYLAPGVVIPAENLNMNQLLPSSWLFVQVETPRGKQPYRRAHGESWGDGSTNGVVWGCS